MIIDNVQPGMHFRLEGDKKSRHCDAREECRSERANVHLRVDGIDWCIIRLQPVHI